ncbi:response regulator [Pedobacter xixiisoli]|uniref:Response regulator receiver domain-containing protein n=1 Tax=Pedobacter xixiisoli TaxID=1476464 RepID=A0A286ACK0_9SPHI|nr:response regulator [Pedobacter xixiisoli]SOD19626.1 Response regulator receiver domain-containing protein [Pedobacter xixiisoli]
MPSPNFKTSLDKKLILLVDDEITVLKLLEFILKKDYNLVIHNNGLEAISWMDEGNMPDLIISDLEMPYVDGLDFVRSLKTSGYYRDIPIILLSAAYSLDDLVQKLPYNFDLLMPKPFNPAKLKETIQNLLS